MPIIFGGNLRRIAQGKPCQLRIPGVCTGDESQTVLCHIRRAGVAGMGQKPPDICAVWGCHACHDVIDGRRKCPESEDLNEIMLSALLRTLNELWRMSVL